MRASRTGVFGAMTSGMLFVLGWFLGSAVVAGCRECPYSCEAGPQMPSGAYVVEEVTATTPFMAGIDPDTVRVNSIDDGDRIQFAWNDPVHGRVVLEYAHGEPQLDAQCYED